jgi:hypothetical protein
MVYAMLQSRNAGKNEVSLASVNDFCDLLINLKVQFLSAIILNDVLLGSFSLQALVTV